MKKFGFGMIILTKMKKTVNHFILPRGFEGAPPAWVFWLEPYHLPFLGQLPSVPTVSPSLGCHINGIVCFAAFCIRRLPLTVLYWRFIYAVSSSSVLFTAEW